MIIALSSAKNWTFFRRSICMKIISQIQSPALNNTNSLANVDSFYANFTNTTFQKISQIQSPALKYSCVHISLNKAQNDLFWFLVSWFFKKNVFVFPKKWLGSKEINDHRAFFDQKLDFFQKEYLHENHQPDPKSCIELHQLLG